MTIDPTNTLMLFYLILAIVALGLGLALFSTSGEHAKGKK